MSETTRREADVIRAAREVVEREGQAMLDIADQIDAQFVELAALLLQTTGKVITAGVGTSGFVARRAAHIFSVTGTPSLFLHPTEAQHGSVGALTRGDVLIVLSKGGGSVEVLTLVSIAKRAGIVVIAITASAETELTKIVDHAVVLRRDDVADLGGVIAMGSTLAHSAWLDAMATVLMRARDYPWESVLNTHPGGAVGRIVDLPAPLPHLDLPTSEADGF